MGLQQFERRLERLVEGVFARAFRSGLQPVEIGRRLTREMDLRRTVAPRGTLTPNAFAVLLSPEDHDRFAPIQEELVAELVEQAREHARTENYVFIGPVSVTIDVDPSLGAGMLLVSGEMERAGAAAAAGAAPVAAAAQPAPVQPVHPPLVPPRAVQAPPVGAGAADPTVLASSGPRAALVGPDGQRVVLGTAPAVLGRLPECDIVLADPNVSRRHAEVAPGDGGWVLRDLGSTNGTRRNGLAVREPVRLAPGDEITIGASLVRFEV